jgi:hypothetical protein
MAIALSQLTSDMYRQAHAEEKTLVDVSRGTGPNPGR